MLVQRSFIYEQRKKKSLSILEQLYNIHIWKKLRCIVTLMNSIRSESIISTIGVDSTESNTFVFISCVEIQCKLFIFRHYTVEFMFEVIFYLEFHTNLTNWSILFEFRQFFWPLREEKKVDILNHFIIIIKSIFKQNQIHLALWNCHFELHTEHVFRLLSPHSPKTKPTATLSNKTCFPNQFNTFQYSVIKHISMHKISCFLETATGFTDHW